MWNVCANMLTYAGSIASSATLAKIIIGRIEERRTGLVNLSWKAERLPACYYCVVVS
jgi:hypothetical protein